MKQIYTLILSLSCIALTGQISISKFSMPDVGNTLKTYTTVAAGVDLGNGGGPQVWDFSSLSKDAYQETELLDPSEGSISNIDATFLIKSVDFVEQYYSRDYISTEEIYIKTLDPVFNTFEITNPYAKNPVYRWGTYIYGQTYTHESRFEAALAWDDLPDTITGGIGLQLDSVRFNTNFKRTDNIDAYGTVKLPDGDWEALRENSVTERFVTIDIFFLGTWIEAPADLLEAFIGDFADFLDPDTTYSTNFYTDQAIEVLAAFTLSGENGDPISVTFKAGSDITETYNPEYATLPDVSVYPNPSYGNVSFRFENCRPGQYVVEIYDVVGKEIWKKSYLLKDNKKPMKADLSMLQKGTYLYTVTDPRGKKVATKRLVIINP